MKLPFVVNSYLTGIAREYKNPDLSLIADEVLPRVQVGARKFEYTVFPTGDAFTVPDTSVGRTGTPNQVEFGGTREGSFVEDHGLDDPIPYDDIAEAQANGGGYDPRAHAAAYTSGIIQLDREVRVANMIFNAASFASGHKTTLASATQWSHADSDPANAILEAMDGAIFPYNTLVLGARTWMKLRQNKKLVEKVLGTASTSGLLTRQQVQDALEIPRILVGASRVNTARKGQTAVLSRTWGNHAALLYIDSSADTNRGITFGFTAEWGQRVSGEILEDPNIGLRGGVKIRTGESVRELVVASDCGYFFQDAVS